MVKPLQTTLLLLLCSCAVIAEPDKPKTIQDLQYGEVLFHFFQQNYFTSLTNLMISEQKELFQHHKQDAELLKGGLQLSYGMDKSATAQFSSISSEDLSADTRNRISYYLGRIQYQRGDYEAAQSALLGHTTSVDSELYTRLALLHTNSALAAGSSQSINYDLGKSDDPLAPYLKLSNGVAQIRNKDARDGWAILNALGTETPEGEEALALRDRTNLGLGYELLRNGDFENAREVLNRVRLDGPFTNAALLGAGWADAERDDLESALQAWLHLFEQTRFDSSVHEAHLAVPYALMKTGNAPLAVDYYRRAVEYFDVEQSRLKEAGLYARSDALLPELESAIPASSGGWLIDAPKLKNLKIGRFLPDLLAEHRFHEPLKNFRDLGFLINNLETWREQTGVFSYMVNTRRLAYKEKAPALLSLLDTDQASQLTQRHQKLSDEIDTRKSSDDPLAFKNSIQARQWDHLEGIIERASKLPDNKRIEKLVQKATRLQGVLRWQIQIERPNAQWQLTKSMKALATDIESANQLDDRATASLDRLGVDYDAYDTRIDHYANAIDALLIKLRQMHITSGKTLQGLIASALDTHQKRIIAYRSQARYALARALDQQSTGEASNPKVNLSLRGTK